MQPVSKSVRVLRMDPGFHRQESYGADYSSEAGSRLALEFCLLSLIFRNYYFYYLYTLWFRTANETLKIVENRYWSLPTTLSDEIRQGPGEDSKEGMHPKRMHSLEAEIIIDLEGIR